jgi:hypothetical protein
MTTQIRVINEGPSKVRVSSIDPVTGTETGSYAAKELVAGELLPAHSMYVHNGASLRIDEVKD